jgi:replisome organiser protein
MAFLNGRRQWVKLWTVEWLSGTMRFQMTAEQRGLWADFLALAGASRVAGVICAGETKGVPDAYPLDYLASYLRCSEESLRAAIELFQSQERISVKDGVIYITNWPKYQSEYQRQKPYRKIEPGGDPEGTIIVSLSEPDPPTSPNPAMTPSLSLRKPDAKLE